MSVVLQALQSSPTFLMGLLLLLLLLVARLRSLKYAGPRRQFEMKLGAAEVRGTRDAGSERN